jgi:hypothetical protein
MILLLGQTFSINPLLHGRYRLSSEVRKIALNLLHEDDFSTDTHLESLRNKIHECVSTSISKFRSGDSYYSNPKDQMGTWIDQDQLLIVMDMLKNSTFSSANSFAPIILSSPECIHIEIISNSSIYALNFYHIPLNSSLPKLTHASGTVLLSSQLYGAGKITSFIKNREIATLDLHENGPTYMRVGGPSRLIESLPTKALGMLELVIYSPRANENGMNSDEGHNSDM